MSGTITALIRVVLVCVIAAVMLLCAWSGLFVTDTPSETTTTEPTPPSVAEQARAIGLKHSSLWDMYIRFKQPYTKYVDPAITANELSYLKQYETLLIEEGVIPPPKPCK